MKKIRNILWLYFKENTFSIIVAIFLFIGASFLAMIPAKLYQLIIDDAFVGQDINVLIKLSGLLLVIFGMRHGFEFISNKKLIGLGNGLLRKMKSEIYAKLFTMDFSFYSKNETGYINSRVEEISSIDTLFSNMTIMYASHIIEFVFAIIILYSLNWRMLLVMSIPLPILAFFSWKMTKIYTDDIQKTLDSTADYSGKVNETIRGMENVKTQGLEDKESEKLNKYNNKMLSNHKKQSNTINIFTSGLGLVGSLTNVFIYFVGGLFFIYGDLTLGSFIAISTYVGKLYAPILGYSGMAMMVTPAFLALKRVASFLFSDEVDEKYFGNTSLSEIESISVENISFTYPDSKQIFNDFSIYIKEGDKIHIKGSNGSGKSTLLKLLLKLYLPQKGKIMFNNIDYSNISRESLINRISYVSQKNFVLNDTIESNITYGIENYDRDLYENIIEGLGLNTLIEKLNKENEPTIGEGGCRLSGGENQKIAIARAMLGNRDVFIFDEATNNLDKQSIELIKNFINRSKAIWLIIDHQNDYSKLGFETFELK